MKFAELFYKFKFTKQYTIALFYLFSTETKRMTSRCIDNILVMRSLIEYCVTLCNMYNTQSAFGRFFMHLLQQKRFVKIAAVRLLMIEYGRQIANNKISEFPEVIHIVAAMPGEESIIPNMRVKAITSGELVTPFVESSTKFQASDSSCATSSESVQSDIKTSKSTNDSLNDIDDFCGYYYSGAYRKWQGTSLYY